MPKVIHYPERRRFQIDIDGLEAGSISYHRGIAKLLVSALMEYAETHNIPLTASCDYAAQFIG